ncbi:transposase [Acinetobacter nectaris]|nr:transposase [Acinetobacter nectaris]
MTEDEHFNWVIIDSTEMERERPKKQWKYYSGKKKRHTLKAQVIYPPKSQKIIGVDISFGREHDISLAKRTIYRLNGIDYVMGDLGYYGLKENGFNLLIPYKKPKKLDLTWIEKVFNKQLSYYRIKKDKAY